jgi:hypothetical protein
MVRQRRHGGPLLLEGFSAKTFKLCDSCGLRMIPFNSEQRMETSGLISPSTIYFTSSFIPSRTVLPRSARGPSHSSQCFFHHYFVNLARRSVGRSTIHRSYASTAWQVPIDQSLWFYGSSPATHYRLLLFCTIPIDTIYSESQSFMVLCDNHAHLRYVGKKARKPDICETWANVVAGLPVRNCGWTLCEFITSRDTKREKRWVGEG